jgi:hypothetical protein
VVRRARIRTHLKFGPPKLAQTLRNGADIASVTVTTLTPVRGIFLIAGLIIGRQHGLAERAIVTPKGWAPTALAEVHGCVSQQPTRDRHEILLWRSPETCPTATERSRIQVDDVASPSNAGFLLWTLVKLRRSPVIRCV